MSERAFGGLVKAVVDVNKEIMVIDAGMHADEEYYLLESGSKQDDLWGINFYPNEPDEGFIEFDSMINIRPRLYNLTRDVTDKRIRKEILRIVRKLIIP